MEFPMSLLSRAWAIDPTWVRSQIPALALLLNGDKGFNKNAYRHHAFDDKGTPRETISQVIAGIPTANIYPWTPADANLPNGTIAIIEISGPIIKNGNWYLFGTNDYVQAISQAQANENIKAIVLKLDTPGGMVDGTQTLANAIAESEKPIYGFVNDGMAASAGYWILSQTKGAYASMNTDNIGSIGVYCSFMDFQPALEKFGVKFHEIYAPESSEKNADFRAAKSGDNSLIESKMSFIAQEFKAAVQRGRGDKIKVSTKEDPFKGGLYYAEEALSIGLIDGIMSWGKFINLIDKEVSSLQTDNTNIDRNNMTDSKISTLIGAETITEELLSEANAEIASKGLKLINQAESDSYAKMASEIANLNSQITALQDELRTANQAAQEANSALAELQKSHDEMVAATVGSAEDAQAAIATLKGEAGSVQERIAGMEAEIKTLGERAAAGRFDNIKKIDQIEASEAQKIMDSLPHNRKADSL